MFFSLLLLQSDRTSDLAPTSTHVLQFYSTPPYLLVCFGLLLHILLNFFYKLLQLSHQLHVTAGQLLCRGLEHIPNWSERPGIKSDKTLQKPGQDMAFIAINSHCFFPPSFRKLFILTQAEKSCQLTWQVWSSTWHRPLQWYSWDRAKRNNRRTDYLLNQ